MAISLGLIRLIQSDEPGALQAKQSSTAAFSAIPAVEFTLFSNDSLSTLAMSGRLIPEQAWDTLLEANYALDISPIAFSECIQTINDSLLYLERWDTLPQTRFWRRIMTLRRDTLLINVAQTRQVLGKMSVYQWELMEDERQEIYRDSLRDAFAVANHHDIFLTAGKQHYYQFRKAVPSVSRGVEIFTHIGVDPWFAQAILLIESPGQLHTSPVGAYGSFQLMSQVALEHGLVVNDSIDERADFDKSAKAAASLIRKRCVPQIRHILRKHNLAFRESDLWFRLMVLHAYHAGAGNVAAVLEEINPTQGGMSLIQAMWKTESGGFKNASQNYSQVALASLLELDRLLQSLPDTICREQQVWANNQTGASQAEDTLVKSVAPPTFDPADIVTVAE
ncbi:MAG: transglycosylase SLT domain-containing protein [Bacteroidota bacterium]